MRGFDRSPTEIPLSPPASIELPAIKGELLMRSIASLPMRSKVQPEIVPDEEATCMGTLGACQRGYKADAAIITEPTNMRVGTAVRGHMGGHVTVLGRAGHAEQPQPHFQQGGAVNAIDVQLCINATLGDDISPHNPDLNNDGTANAIDVQLVINNALGVY